MIKFSRHSKRRMNLYNLTEDDVIEVINRGNKEIIKEHKISFIASLDNYNYPIKVICKIINDDILVISNYLLKKRL